MSINLFGWMRDNPESIPLLEEQTKELAKTRAELEETREELQKARSELKHAQIETSMLESQCKSLIDRQKTFESAKEKGCVRGEYCRNCAFGVLVDYDFAQKCVCVYGECAHFRDRKGGNNEPT